MICSENRGNSWPGVIISPPARLWKLSAPSSPALREALLIKIEQEKCFGVRGRLEHIPTEENEIADLLSHGKIEEAKRILIGRWGFARMMLVDASFVVETLGRVRAAINRESSPDYM